MGKPKCGTELGLNQTFAKSRHELHILRRRVEQAWRSRWQAVLSCAATKAFARSLLELRTSAGADGDTPASHDVFRDFAGSEEEAWAAA